MEAPDAGADWARDVHELGVVVAELRDVVAKTKLLGFNAAIVAAQAGEQGRSFAVVAEQMKALNQRALRAVRTLDAQYRQLQAVHGRPGDAPPG